MSLLEFTLARPAVHWWCSVPGEPSAKERPRRGRFGKQLFTPKKTLDAQSDLAWAFKAMHPSCRLDGTSQFGIRAVFYCWRRSKNPDNMWKILADSMEDVIYVDDVQVREMYGRIEFVSKDAARTEFVVYKLEAK